MSETETSPALKVIEDRHAELERLAQTKPENIVPGTFHAPEVTVKAGIPFEIRHRASNSPSQKTSSL